MWRNCCKTVYNVQKSHVSSLGSFVFQLSDVGNFSHFLRFFIFSFEWYTRLTKVFIYTHSFTYTYYTRTFWNFITLINFETNLKMYIAVTRHLFIANIYFNKKKLVCSMYNYFLYVNIILKNASVRYLDLITLL